MKWFRKLFRWLERDWNQTLVGSIRSVIWVSSHMPPDGFYQHAITDIHGQPIPGFAFYPVQHGGGTPWGKLLSNITHFPDRLVYTDMADFVVEEAAKSDTRFAWYQEDEGPNGTVFCRVTLFWRGEKLPLWEKTIRLEPTPTVQPC